jgi:acyl-CoA synthetase (AMP-forming)/AMP-acid ligase II
MPRGSVQSLRDSIANAPSGRSLRDRAAQVSVAVAPQIKDDILALCRQTLPRHKVPVAISIVPSLDVAPTGKLARRHG